MAENSLADITVYCLAFLSLSLALCQATLKPAFILTSNPEQVTRGTTENVTLRCRHNGSARSQMLQVSAISLLKWNGMDYWNLVAAKSNYSQAPVNSHNHFSVSGDINVDIQSAFLEIMWPVATDDTMGVFRCDVLGVDSYGYNVEESSPLLEITDLYITDLMALLLNTKRELEDNARDVETKQNLETKTLEKKVDLLNRNLEHLTEEVKSLKKKINSDSNDVEMIERNMLGFWPGGFYAILQSAAGCPQSSVSLGGNESYYKIHTESGQGSRNKDSHSSALPTGTSSADDDNNNFMTMRFCETSGGAMAENWPTGSYCINKLDNKPCPPYFEEGSVELDGEDTANADEYAGNVVFTPTGHFHQVGFCCTDSDNPDLPVMLPTRSPFLLYRRGGACQRVFHMRSSEETLVVDTEDQDNGDTTRGVTPDIDINIDSKTTFHLCHYYK